jgi:hypothetical protein
MVFPFTKVMDHHVERQFRKDPSGRLVFLPFGPKRSASFVDSKSDEEKIRAFVKMYRSAGALISQLAFLSFYVWIWSSHAGAGPLRSRETTEVGIVSFCLLVLLLSVWMLWSLYKQTVPAFTSLLSEVGPDLKNQLSEVSPRPRGLRRLALVGLFAGIVTLAVAILLAVRHSPDKSACPPRCSSTSAVSQ